VSGLTFVNQVGAVNGLNQAAPGSFIPDTYLRWAQDVLFDRVGYIRRRAPFEIFKLYNTDSPPVETQPSTLNERIIAVVSTLNPAGQKITGLVVTTGSASKIRFYDQEFKTSNTTDIDLVPADAIFDCTQASSNGSWMGFLESYESGEGANEYYQYYWFGGCGLEQTVANCDLGVTTTSPSKHSTYTNIISGTFNASTVTPGMFVYVEYDGNDYYIGTVKTVTSSQVNLEKDIIRFVYSVDISGATYNDNLTLKFRNVRPYIHVHGRGLITRDSTSTTTVTSGSVGTEGEGHFQSAQLAKSPYWALYRASDGEWIGDIATVTNNSTLVLDTDQHSTAANSVLRADEYNAYQYAPVPSTTLSGRDPSDVAGVFTATYAGYQWYGNAGDATNRSRIVFSAYHNAEAVDLSIDGADSIIIPGTAEMRGLASSTAGLLVFMEDKTYIVRGNYRANFSLEELYPEGCLSAMSITEHGGGVFWASHVGILFYDGASVRNLTESNLGVYYTDSIKTYNAQADRVYGFLHKDYLFMHFTNFNSAFNPARYEPIYAEGIATTPAISNFVAEDDNPDTPDWDPDFTIDDFNPVNNVPVYWDYITLYESVGTDATGIMPLWGGGLSYPLGDVTNTSTTVSGLSSVYRTVTGAATTNTSTTVTGLSDMTSGDVGRLISGTNIPSSTTISSVTNATTVVMSAAATGTGTTTVTLSGIGAGDVGKSIVGYGIPDGTTISSRTNATTIVMSAAATATSSNTTDPRSSVQIAATAPAYQWGTTGTQYVWGPIRQTEGITFAIYLPTNALTALTNFDFRGATKFDSTSGIKALMGVNVKNPTGLAAGVYPRLVDVDSILRTDNLYNEPLDAELIENTGKALTNYIKGPDFYLQTKQYTVGDPVLRKWFRQLFLNLYLTDGAIRLDLVDDEDNDRIDIQKKRRQNWEIFEEMTYTWAELQDIILPKRLSPNRSTWGNIENLNTSWYELVDAAFERRKKKISWRYPSLGFRLYQMNNYRPANYQTSQRPHTIMLDAWNIGFKPMRSSRV
jgi:hypothetical protein